MDLREQIARAIIKSFKGEDWYPLGGWVDGDTFGLEEAVIDGRFNLLKAADEILSIPKLRDL